MLKYEKNLNEYFQRPFKKKKTKTKYLKLIFITFFLKFSLRILFDGKFLFCDFCSYCEKIIKLIFMIFV